jgi:hypothetical protein
MRLIANAALRKRYAIDSISRTIRQQLLFAVYFRRVTKSDYEAGRFNETTKAGDDALESNERLARLALSGGSLARPSRRVN